MASTLTHRYTVNEIFYSLQGEGIRAGTANVFVRFSGCNMECDVEEGPKSPGGFRCDTEFVSSRKQSLDELMQSILDIAPKSHRAAILTGGEPGLQITPELLSMLRANQFYIAIETNGSIPLPDGIDWITVSPKVAEHAIRQRWAHEVKYVRGYGQAIPKTVVKADHYLISPAFDGENVSQRTLGWCIDLVKDNPPWRLSLQTHKFMRIR